MNLRLIYLAIFSILLAIPILDAYAYLDPSSGNIVIQMLIGILVGISITIKMYWIKIKMVFSKKTTN